MASGTRESPPSIMRLHMSNTLEPQGASVVAGEPNKLTIRGAGYMIGELTEEQRSALDAAISAGLCPNCGRELTANTLAFRAYYETGACR